MSHQSDLIASDIDAYLHQHENKELLRFITCGSVDDGKSTLIGKLLYESKMIYEDQLQAITRDSETHGTTGGGFDPALLTDGLKAEREQGITIDVAYRYFSTAKRKFIIADTPGHEQYTRNMATGASTANLAVILIDARHGILEQTRRHSFIVSLLGIKHAVVAVIKMDLVDYNEETYERIKKEYIEFSARLDIADVHFIPMSALLGDNVVDAGGNMPWYTGSPLMSFLESVVIAADANYNDFRFPVQLVNRPHLDFRGFCGTIASGIVRRGDEIIALPSRKTSRVKSIVTYEGELEEAFTPQSITLTLEDEIDVSRGDMLCRPGNQPSVGSKFDAMVVWMSEEPLLPGKQYMIKQAATNTPGVIHTLHYRVDVNTLHRAPGATLNLNEIGRCSLDLTQEVAYDDYRRSRGTGSFIVIDRMTNITVGAGMILDRRGSQQKDHWDDEPASTDLRGEISRVTQEERNARYGQQAATVLLTGLTGAGKTTIAYALERKLFESGRAATVLDGQNLRLGISRELGFSADERSENMRRGAEIAKIMNDSGLICLAAILAPSEDVRQRAKQAVGEQRFFVVHLSAPIEICRERAADYYAKADAGELSSIPGVSASYDAPESPDLVLPTHELEVEESVERIMGMMREKGILS
jgi:bifunctional enzyme CysN/CysC